jgi:hypothetical protein
MDDDEHKQPSQIISPIRYKLPSFMAQMVPKRTSRLFSPNPPKVIQPLDQFQNLQISPSLYDDPSLKRAPIVNSFLDQLNQEYVPPTPSNPNNVKTQQCSNVAGAGGNESPPPSDDESDDSKTRDSRKSEKSRKQKPNRDSDEHPNQKPLK